MSEVLKSEPTIRDYLLGRVSDETALKGIEKLLFTDEEFCSRVELAEDELINDYVFGHLDQKDEASFNATLGNNPDRRFKLELTQALREKALVKDVLEPQVKPSFISSLKAFFSQPKYVGAFALVLIAALVAGYFLTRRGSTDDLADLRAMYQKERPTESRIAEFNYAPLSQLRGALAPADQKRLRRIELNLIDATEKNPNSRTYHALGVFHLTQHDYAKAVEDFVAALKFGERDARIHNDLGSAHFELAKAGAADKKLAELDAALEEFTTATELDPKLLEALFNRSLALQEWPLPRDATASWNLYLQKDPSSPWADEARKNLSQIQGEQTLFKTDEQVLADFLDTYRQHDLARAQKIHYETKGLLTSATVPFQLSRLYLVAQQQGNSAAAREILDALAFIGRFEHDQHSEFFFRH